MSKEDKNRGHFKPIHGVDGLIKRGRLPSLRGKRKVQKALNEIEAKLVAELGGWEDISPQQEILLRSTMTCYAVVLLTQLFVNKYGPLRPDEARKGVLSYHPLLERTLATYINTCRLNLEKLFPQGLARAKAEEESLYDYIARKYGNGPGKPGGQGEDKE